MCASLFIPPYLLKVINLSLTKVLTDVLFIIVKNWK